MKHHTEFTTSVNQKNNNTHQWTPTYLDKEGSRLALLLGCGSLGPTIYLVLCHLEAGRKTGWSGSTRQLQVAISALGGGKPRRENISNVVAKLEAAGILETSPATGQQTVFKIVALDMDQPDADDDARPTDDKLEVFIYNKDNQLIIRFDALFSPDVSRDKSWISYISADGTKRTIKTEDIGHIVEQPIPIGLRTEDIIDRLSGEWVQAVYDLSGNKPSGGCPAHDFCVDNLVIKTRLPEDTPGRYGVPCPVTMHIREMMEAFYSTHTAGVKYRNNDRPHHDVLPLAEELRR